MSPLPQPVSIPLRKPAKNNPPSPPPHWCRLPIKNFLQTPGSRKKPRIKRWKHPKTSPLPCCWRESPSSKAGTILWPSSTTGLLPKEILSLGPRLKRSSPIGFACPGGARALIWFWERSASDVHVHKIITRLTMGNAWSSLTSIAKPGIHSQRFKKIYKQDFQGFPCRICRRRLFLFVIIH